MKQRVITTSEQLAEAASDLMMIAGHLPIVISITEGTKTRTSGQNSRYWSDIESFLFEIQRSVIQIAEYTGYTPMEVRRTIGTEIPIEHVPILFATKKETVHDTLKMICEIPTSTRLGTKSFGKFEERLSQIMSEIIGSVNAVTKGVIK